MNLKFEDIYPNNEDKSTKKLIDEASTDGSGTCFPSCIHNCFSSIYYMLSCICDSFYYVCNSFFNCVCFFLSE